MSFHYQIDTDLNLILYVGIGPITTLDFFKTGDLVADDPRLHAHMKIIIDVSMGEFEVHPSDIKLVVRKFNESKQRGQDVGRTAVLSRSSGLKFLNDAFKLIMDETALDTRIFHTEEDVIRWHGLPKERALVLWKQVREQARDTAG